MDEPVVKITLTKTYEKLDGLEKQVSSDFSEIKLSLQEVQLTLKAFADHERRIRILEEWRWKQAGVPALLGAVPSALIVLFVTRLFSL